MTPTSPAYYASAGSIGSRAHEVDETIIGVRPTLWISAENSAPTAKELFDWAHTLDADTLNGMVDQPLTATGIVTYMGLDIHSLPSLRLSDDVNGSVYVHMGNRDKAVDTVHAALDMGITLFNTGEFYCGGASEMVLGEALSVSAGITPSGTPCAPASPTVPG